jgi:hypothetical protein
VASEETEEAGPFVERVAALDIGKAGLVACLRVPAEGGDGRRRQEVSDWSTMTADLVNLADRLVCQGVELVGNGTPRCSRTWPAASYGVRRPSWPGRSRGTSRTPTPPSYG